MPPDPEGQRETSLPNQMFLGPDVALPSCAAPLDVTTKPGDPRQTSRCGPFLHLIECYDFENCAAQWSE